jgi:hypothetical protein
LVGYQPKWASLELNANRFSTLHLVSTAHPSWPVEFAGARSAVISETIWSAAICQDRAQSPDQKGAAATHLGARSFSGRGMLRRLAPALVRLRPALGRTLEPAQLSGGRESPKENVPLFKRSSRTAKPLPLRLYLNTIVIPGQCLDGRRATCTCMGPLRLYAHCGDAVRRGPIIRSWGPCMNTLHGVVTQREKADKGGAHP